MNPFFIFTIFSALAWSICIILEKYYLLNYFEPQELLLLRNSMFIFVFIIYLFMNKSYITKIKNASKKMYLHIFASFFFSSLALLTYWYLLQNTKTSYTVASVQPLIIMMVVLASHVFYNEKISLINGIGILFTIVGIYLLNV
jgi:uncharacterized membrane protein